MKLIVTGKIIDGDNAMIPGCIILGKLDQSPTCILEIMRSFVAKLE